MTKQKRVLIAVLAVLAGMGVLSRADAKQVDIQATEIKQIGVSSNPDEMHFVVGQSAVRRAYVDNQPASNTQATCFNANNGEFYFKVSKSHPMYQSWVTLVLMAKSTDSAFYAAGQTGADNSATTCALSNFGMTP